MSNFSLDKSVFLHFIVEVDFQLLGALKIFRVGRVVKTAVGEDSVHVSFEEMSGDVIPKMQILLNKLQLEWPRLTTYLFLILSPIVLRSIGYLMCS